MVGIVITKYCSMLLVTLKHIYKYYYMILKALCNNILADLIGCLALILKIALHLINAGKKGDQPS